MPNNDFELFKYLHEEQRDQLTYRRNREFQIFTWSATLLLAIVGLLIVKDPDKDVLLTKALYARLLGSVVVLGVGTYSALWQIYQRQRAAAHQRVLVKLAEKLGCFERGPADETTLYPYQWKSWGTRYNTFREQVTRPSKVSATMALMVIALVSIWLDILL